MTNLVSPGVQVREIDLTNVIPSATTSIGAIAGNFVWGPVEDVVTIGTEKDLTTQFGKPHPLAAADFTNAAMFLKYSSALRVVRGVTAGARNATSDDVATAVLIKNDVHYEELSPTLQTVEVLNPVVTVVAYAGETQVTVDDASGLTLGDVITGSGIAAGTTIVGITGNVLTLSQPLLGTIPVSSYVNDLVQINGLHTVVESFAKGSYQITAAIPPANGYQTTAKVSHPALPASTSIVGYTASGTVTLSAALKANVPNTDTVLVTQSDNVARVTVTAASTVVQNFIPANTSVVSVNDASLFVVGDKLSGLQFASGTTVTAIDTTTDKITISKPLVANLISGDPISKILVTPKSNTSVVTAPGSTVIPVVDASLFAVSDVVNAGAIVAGTTVLSTRVVDDTLTAAIAVGDTVIAVTTPGNFAIGDIVTAAGFPANTKVTAIGVGSITVDTAATTVMAVGAAISVDTITISAATTIAIASGTSIGTETYPVVDTVLTTSALTGETKIFVVDASQFLVGDIITETIPTYFAANTVITAIDVVNDIVTIDRALIADIPSTTAINVARYQSVAIGSTVIPLVDSLYMEIGDEISCLGVPVGAKVVGVDAVLKTITIDLPTTDLISAGALIKNVRTMALGATIGTGYMPPVAAATSGAGVIGMNAIVVMSPSLFRVGDILSGGGFVAGTKVTAVDLVTSIVTFDQPLSVAIPAASIITINRTQAIAGEAACLFVLDTVDGLAFGDTITSTASIPDGTKITYIDSVNKVIGINNFLTVDEPMLDVLDIFSRALVAQDQLTQQVTLMLDNVGSVKAGDSISDVDASGNLIQKGITTGSKVVSVNYVTKTVTLDKPLTGSIPVAAAINDVLTVDVYRGLAYACYPGVLGNSLHVEVCGSAASYATWKYRGLFNSAPGTSDYAASRGGSNDELHIVVVDKDGKFTGTPGQVLEKFAYASQARDAKLADGTSNYYVRLLNETSKYLWWGAHPVALTEAGSFAENVTFSQLPAVLAYDLSGGVDSEALGDAEFSTCYELFRDAETVSIDFLIQPSITTKVVPLLLMEIAEFRKDCVAFISPPVSLSIGRNPVEDVIAWFDQMPSSSYSVFDNTALKVYDKYNDQYLWIPASSSVAGLCANTDDARDPWWSPAGLNRGQLRGVIKLAHNPKQTDRDELYQSRINPIVTFAGEGTVLYGDKTAQTKPSAFDRINVRRLFITLEKAISTAARYMLFEFNDPFTRAQFKAMVEPFLRDVQARRGVTDFYVVCDESNNTPQIIDTNQFVGDIYLKPNRSINFIQLNFVAVRTGVSFQEIATGEYQ